MNETNMDKLKKQAEELASLTLKDAKALIDILKAEYGIEAATPVAVAGPGAAESQEAKEEKTIFDVVLKSVGTSKPKVIKIVKGLLGLGLKETMNLVNGAPVAIKEGMSKEEAEKIKQELEEAGAEVELS